MIVAKADRNLLIVLEPGNVDLLQVGNPIPIPVPSGVDEVLIAYTPDILWVIEEVKKGRPMGDAIQASLTRQEVHSRPHHKVETIVDVKG